MKNQRVLIVLTLVNLGILICLLIRLTPSAEANGPAPLLRARALEIVDAQGKVRASLQVIPEGPSRRADGKN